MRQWTIGKRLIAGFGVILVGVIAVGGYSASKLLSLNADADRIANDSLPGTALSGQVLARVKDNYILALQHMHAASPADMAAAEESTKQVAADIGRMLADYEKTITQADDRANFDEVKPAREAFLRARDRVVSLDRDGRHDEAVKLFAGELTPAYQSYVDRLRAVSDWNIKAGQQVGGGIEQDVRAAVWGVSIGVIVLALAAGVIAFLVVRSTNTILRGAVGELRQGAEQVVSASSQVASSAQALSQGSTEQAASLEETSASMEEMASMTRKNAENSERAATLMQDVDRRVLESNQALEDMVRSMGSIKESSDKVAKIIKTIDEIAFQTNILALNAAVEAARAGEAGMGFAVVADEVRTLAQRSAQAAKDTAVLIEESITRSTEGTTKVQQVAGTITAITESVGQVKGLVAEVSVASREQAQGIDQVTQAVTQMEKVTQTTAASAEESAAASEELSAQAEATMRTVRDLAALVDTTDAEGVRAPAGPKAAGPRKPGGKVAAFVSAKTATPRRQTAEEAIPLGDGTYGRF